jgi:hypothetical protein
MRLESEKTQLARQADLVLISQQANAAVVAVRTAENG